jgi:hypothetical protein
MYMTRDHRLYIAYTYNHETIALCCIYLINQHSYYYGKQLTHFSISVLFPFYYVLIQVMKKMNIKTIQTFRWILILISRARPPPFLGTTML